MEYMYNLRDMLHMHTGGHDIYLRFRELHKPEHIQGIP